ncbi:uncharacterized protein K460DRAFT_3178 [Cucurbitaria berberidis CBS 394.84]|uniref:BTB domain-containing protein n=1 Tax=Cucurbitaria berberidis CBS 394.84 TaxID=1168544 RepID=A0A9P4LBM4_9PLEO|nr:uncharacterized protein K460DRAFT_3178 [Cucurbitaria berberidis CBS 394.84]KAF1849756.1 hypothetical protein K460DRAFT_3178 [Cucurbitaria berberidis CBS 394.84]
MGSNEKSQRSRPAPSASAVALSSTIIVKVGAKQKKYTLHRKLLVYHSEYFRSALSGKFRETDDGVIVLNDIDTDAFDIFVDWIYETKLPTRIDTDAPGDGRTSVKYRAYVLAEKLLATDFKRILMDLIFTVIRNKHANPASALIIYAFENLPEKDAMLRLLVDAWCVHDSLNRMGDDDKALLPQLPQVFLCGVIMKLNQLGKATVKNKKLWRKDYIGKELEDREGYLKHEPVS